jgi:hypothetical protein
VVAHLLAVQRLVSAYRALNGVVAERIGAGSASTFDVEAMANIVGVLSPEVEVVNETVYDEEAVLTYTVDGRVPLEEAILVRRNNRWLLQTEPPVPELAAELLALANVADRVALELRARKMTAEDLQAELALRQRPILERIRKLDAAQQSAGNPARH